MYIWVILIRFFMGYFYSTPELFQNNFFLNKQDLKSPQILCREAVFETVKFLLKKNIESSSIIYPIELSLQNCCMAGTLSETLAVQLGLFSELYRTISSQRQLKENIFLQKEL